jgi:hypothetical protein
MALATAGIPIDPGLTVFGAGWATWLVAGGYAGGMWLLHAYRGEPPFEPMHLEPITARPAAGERHRALAGFAASGIAIVVATRYLAGSAAELADLLGIASGFTGLALLAFVTTLPEMAVSAASVRIGAYDLAVGNLLRSNAASVWTPWQKAVLATPSPTAGNWPRRSMDCRGASADEPACAARPSLAATRRPGRCATKPQARSAPRAGRTVSGGGTAPLHGWRATPRLR